jgi:hypothetical protein
MTNGLKDRLSEAAALALIAAGVAVVLWLFWKIPA